MGTSRQCAAQGRGHGRTHVLPEGDRTLRLEPRRPAEPGRGDASGRTRAEGKSHNFPAALPDHLAEQAEEALKSSYNLEFLGLAQAVREREIEDRLIERLQDFLLELGLGFAFLGRQYRLTLGDKEYFVNLLFYHRFLKVLVAVELKVGPFEPE